MICSPNGVHANAHTLSYQQGTWGCSILNNCYYTQAKGTNIVIIALLRVMRIFRIFWIFKNFNILSADTVLGRLQVLYSQFTRVLQYIMFGLMMSPQSFLCVQQVQVIIWHLRPCFFIINEHLHFSSLVFLLQYELMGWYWLVSVAELLIVLVFLGHCAGCFMYMFGGSVYWRTSGECVMDFK
jgi:hypothetical protein